MNKLYYSHCAWNYSSNPTLFFGWDSRPAFQRYSLHLPKFILKCVLKIFWPLQVLITISMKRQTSSFFQRKSFVKLNQELLTVVLQSSSSATPNLLPPSHSFWVALSALENCGSSNLHHLLCNPIFKPLAMGFYTLNFSDGWPKTGGLRIPPFEISSGKQKLGPNVFSGGAAAQRLAASLMLTVFLEKANGNRQITPPRGFIWSPKISQLLGRF